MSLETQLREALVEQRADEIYKQFTSKNQYKAMVGEFIEDLGNSIIESIAISLGDIEPDEKEKMLAKYRAEFLPKINAQFDNPEQLRQIFTEQARNQYMTSDELRAKMVIQVREIRESEDLGIDECAMTNFEKAYEKVYEKVFDYAQVNDRILKRLSEIAEAEGLEKATQKETRYVIIREIFPTVDSFRNYSTRDYENVISLFQEMSNAFVAEGEAGQLMGGMFGAIGSVMVKLMEVGEKITADYLDKTIQEIYE
jgi:hypothetical protein